MVVALFGSKLRCGKWTHTMYFVGRLRKNYLFAGSHQGALRAAMMYSFFASYKDVGVNPLEWLADVLGKIGTHPVNQLDDLLHAIWARTCSCSDAYIIWTTYCQLNEAKTCSCSDAYDYRI